MYEANYYESEKSVTRMLLTENVPLMNRVVDRENDLHNDVTKLVQNCIDRTGRIPEIHIEVAHGISSTEKRRGRYKLGEGITGRVIESGRPMAVPKIDEEAFFSLDKEEI